MVQRYKILLILIAKKQIILYLCPEKINYLSNKPFKFCCVMKVLRVLFMSLALLMVSGLSAQTVYNSNGSSCGKIESNGTVRNSSGSSIGKIESNGTVRNASGSSIGKIESDGTIRNGSGSSIGKVESDGTVRNSSGSKIGKVESDGTVRNGNGSSIGKVQGVPRQWVAAYFFFFF